MTSELGSLIWLDYVKQAVALLSEKFHGFRLCVTAASLIQKQEHFYGCSMLRYVSPLAEVALNEVIDISRSDAALFLILGSWIGLVSAN